MRQELPERCEQGVTWFSFPTSRTQSGCWVEEDDGSWYRRNKPGEQTVRTVTEMVALPGVTAARTVRWSPSRKTFCKWSLQNVPMVQQLSKVASVLLVGR